MSDNFNIYRFCVLCHGTGVIQKRIDNDAEGNVQYEEAVCNDCNGEKKFLWGEMLEQE